MIAEVPEVFRYFATKNLDVATGEVADAAFRCADAHRRGVSTSLGLFLMFLLWIDDCC